MQTYVTMQASKQASPPVGQCQGQNEEEPLRSEKTRVKVPDRAGVRACEVFCHGCPTITIAHRLLDDHPLSGKRLGAGVHPQASCEIGAVVVAVSRRKKGTDRQLSGEGKKKI